MSEPNTAISVSFVLKDAEGNPLVETGREARVTIAANRIPASEQEAKDRFLALVHRGAEQLWDRELRKVWCPTARTS